MLDHYSVAVGNTAPVLLATGTGGDAHTHVYLSNGTGADAYIGDYSVTTADGYLLPKQQATTISYRQEIDLAAGDTLWAICSPTQTTTIQVIVTY